jgi:uncharacterized protein
LPIPEPKKGETEEKYVARCMANSIIKKDQLRIDYSSADEKEWLVEPFKLTSEGYLKGRAVITNVGVFPYRMADGSIFYELRPPEEVFGIESLNSFKSLPFTNEHPSEKVTVDNIKKYQKGYCGDNIITDEYHMSNTITITDQDTIGEAQAGKRGISNGYTCDVEETPGVWMGVHYDGIQRNIRGNHVALVERGRAGDAARIRMDSMDSNLGIQEIEEQKQNKGESQMALKKIKIDGVEYEAEADVIKAYTASKEKADELSNTVESLKKDITKLEGERDQYKDEAEKSQKELKEKQDSNLDEEMIEEAVQSRLVVLDAARRAGVEVETKDFNEVNLKKEIIAKLFPNSKTKIDEASEDYVNARFDVALEHLDEIENEDDEEDVNADLRSDGLANVKKKENSDSAYNKMVNRMLNAHKKDGEEE